MAVEVGTAYVTIVPSAKGFARRLQQEIAQEMRQAIEPVTREEGERGGRQFSERFSSAVKASLAGLLRAGLVAGLISSLAVVPQVLAAIVPAAHAAAGAIALLPAVGLGAAAAIGALRIAMAGLGDVVGEALTGDLEKAKEQLAELPPAAAAVAREFIALRPAVDGLRATVAAGLFAPLIGQVTQLAAVYLPTLTARLTEAANIFGRLGVEIGALVAAPEFVLDLNATLGQTNAALAGVLAGVPALLLAFRDIAAVGASFLPGLTDGFAGLTAEFAGFISRARETGALAGFIQGALGVFSALGAIVQQVGGIIVAVISAAKTATEGVGTPLVELLRTVNAFLSAGEGQSALIAVFTALGEIAAAIRPVLGALLQGLGAGLAALAPALAPLISAAGMVVSALAPILPVVGQIIGAIASALTPVIAALLPLAEGLTAGLSGALTPLLPVIGQVGGLLASILLPVAEQLGVAFRVIGPVIGTLVAAIAQALAPALSQLGPIVQQLLAAFLPLAPVLAELAPSLAEIIIAASPLVTIMAQLLALLISIAAPIIELIANLITLAVKFGLAPAISVLADAIGFLLSPLTTLGDTLGDVSGWLNGLDWAGIGRAILDGLGAAVTAVGQFFADLGSTIASAFTSAVSAVGTFLAGLPGRIVGFLVELPSMLQQLATRAFDAFFFAVGFGIGLVIRAFTELPGKIAALVISLWTTVQTLFRNGVNLAIGFVLSLPDRIGALFTSAWNAAKNLTSAGIAAVVGFFSSLPERIASYVRDAWNQATALFRSGVDRVVQFARDLPGRAASAASGLGRAIVNAVQGAVGDFVDLGGRIVDGLASGIRNAVGRAVEAAKRAMQRVVDGAKSALGIASPSKVFRAIGSDTIAGYVVGVNRAAGDAEQAIRDALAPTSLADMALASAVDTAATVVDAKTGGTTYVLAQFGDGPVREMVQGVLVDEPQLVATAVEVGSTQLDRRN